MNSKIQHNANAAMDFFVAVLLEEIKEYAKFAGKMMRIGWVVTDATNFFMPVVGVSTLLQLCLFSARYYM